MHLCLTKVVSYPKNVVVDYYMQEGSVTIALQIQSQVRQNFLKKK